MITSSKVLIGMITFFLLATLMLNWYEGNAMTDNTNILSDSEYETTTTNPDTSGDVIMTMVQGVLDFGSGIIEFVNKYFLFDYICFRDLNATPYTNAQGDTEYPYNDFVILRWMLVAIGIVILIQLALSAKSLLPWFK